MFGSEILDVAIGLVLLFLLLSLVVSSIKEAFETVLNHRSKDLESGIRELLGDHKRTGLVPEFYKHPLITSLFEGRYVRGKTSNLPSYIPSRAFALAVIDLIASKTAYAAAPGVQPASEQTLLQHFETALAQLPGEAHIRGALTPLLLSANGDFRKLQAEVENWFNNSMDRVAGWYKKRTQIIIAAIGLAIAIVMNVDALAILRYLNTNQTARAVLMSRVEHYRAENAAPQNLKTTDLEDPMGWLERQGGLPLGWAFHPAPQQTPADFDRDWRKLPSTFEGWLLKAVGILFTAFAVSLGAPFWFDLLNRIMIVRATVKPEEKSPAEKPKP